MEKPNENLVQFKNPEEEIVFLRQKIAEKEKILAEKNFSIEKDALIKEQISQYAESPIEGLLHKDYALQSEHAEAIVLNLSPEKHDEKMSELVHLLNEKGVKNTLLILSKLKDPHLEDDFHRFLVQYIRKGYEVKDLNKTKKQFKGVGMVLYEVVLPEKAEEEKEKNLKVLISSMEQFFSGMLSIVNKKEKGNYISLEIANGEGSDQIIYYVAVPEKYCELFEKHIISIFSGARLEEIPNDYNIFNEDGISLGSYLKTKENQIYPFKTYEEFDYDPLNVLLNSFSKIQKDGEGAALQIIFSPNDDVYKRKYEYAIKRIEDGVPVKEAINFSNSVIKDIFKTVKEIFVSSAPKEEEKKPIDSVAIEKIKQKISSTIVSTNIRTVVSAKNRPDAERILNIIESSFNQFSRPESNSLVWEKVEKANLQKLFRDFSFRNYSFKQDLPLNLHELTSIFHFHTNTLAPTPQLKQTQSASAPAPSEIINSGVLIGVNSYRNVDTNIYMQDEDRLRHLYVIGQTGTGKTTLLKNMIIQDINAGKGVCMIDPHGTDIVDVLANVPRERYQDVIYFDPSYTERPMALNMLEYDPKFPEQKTFVVNELFSIFQKLYSGSPESMGPMFEQYFRNATMLVIEDPETGCTLLDVSRVMVDKQYRDLKISRCKNPVVVQFWTSIAEKAGGEASLANIVPYITSKFDVFLANEIMRPIIAQEKSSFNFRDIMDNKKILLVNLAKGRLGEINANLIGLILVGKILMAALSRVDMIGQKINPFYLYIDEFQNITTNSISTILSEARKYGLSLTVAHQFIAQLEEGIRDAVFGNVGSIISFRISSEDAELLEKQFAPVFTARDVMNLENHHAYVKMLINGKATKAFNMHKVDFPPKGNPEILESLKQLSYLTYGKDREEIENQIANKYKSTH